MKKAKGKQRLRSFLSWALWVLLVQLILVNISAALYAYKITHMVVATESASLKRSSNIFVKTWKLFSGPKFYRQPLTATPSFPYTEITLTSKNKTVIRGWYAKTDSIARGTVILFHGLSSNKGQVLNEAVAFRNLGYNIMLIDMRSHGNSEGSATSIGFKESEEVKLAYDHVAAMGKQNIFLWGTSMGSVSILKAVAQYDLKPGGLILEMPFISLQAHLKGRARIIGFPQQPFGFLTSFWIGVERGFNGLGFNTTSYAKKVHCPVLYQYGEKDELVVRSESIKIYESIGSTDKRLVSYDNAMHESFIINDPVLWSMEVRAFLEKAPKLTF